MSKHVRLLDKYDAVIIDEKYNKLIGRREVVMKIIHTNEGTPSRGLIKIGLGRLYGKEPNLVFIRRAESSYGFPETLIEAHIYDDLSRAKLFEPEHIIKRDEQSLQKSGLQQ